MQALSLLFKLTNKCVLLFGEWSPSKTATAEYYSPHAIACSKSTFFCHKSMFSSKFCTVVGVLSKQEQVKITDQHDTVSQEWGQGKGHGGIAAHWSQCHIYTYCSTNVQWQQQQLVNNTSHKNRNLFIYFLFNMYSVTVDKLLEANTIYEQKSLLPFWRKKMKKALDKTFHTLFAYESTLTMTPGSVTLTLVTLTWPTYWTSTTTLT